MPRYVSERPPPSSTPTTIGLRFEVSPWEMRFEVSLLVGLLGDPYRTIRKRRKARRKRLRATPHRLLPDDRLSTTVEVLYRTQSVEPTANSAVPPPQRRANTTDSFRTTCSPPSSRPRAPATRPLAPAGQERTNQGTPRPLAPKNGRCRPRLCQSPTEPASRLFANRETRHPATPVTPATRVTTPPGTGGIIDSKHETKTNYDDRREGMNFLDRPNLENPHKNPDLAGETRCKHKKNRRHYRVKLDPKLAPNLQNYAKVCKTYKN